LDATPHLGSRVGAPPGEPGGGITRVVPGSGGRTAISGAILAGGRMMPSVWFSFSLSGALERPTEPVDRGSCCGSGWPSLSAWGVFGDGSGICAAAASALAIRAAAAVQAMKRPRYARLMEVLL
jgi:hypothetical protein